jgi:hypothetical protein
MRVQQCDFIRRNERLAQQLWCRMHCYHVRVRDKSESSLIIICRQLHHQQLAIERHYSQPTRP